MLKEEFEASTPRNGDNSHTITSDSGSNDVAEESHQKFAIKEKLANKMFSYARKIIRFFLVIIFTALAALHSSSPKVSKPPLAKPFFNQNSIVLDFYKGHLGAMIEMVTEADFSFIMYYAPWDAESQAVRQEFEKVAQYHHSEVFFAAINCWHPNSECRMQYNKIQSYPVLMVYPSRDSGIGYSGIRTWPYMIRFLTTVMNPIVRITHKEQLTDLLINYDAVVVGYFNFTRLDKSPGYKEFYKAAIGSLKADPNRELVFAVVTSALIGETEFNISKFPSANMLIWSDTIRYPEESEWTSENILNWISNSMHQPVLWLQPPGIKALTLAPYLRTGPVLFLFTPRNPLHPENYNYNLIKEIGLQYYNCANNVLAKNIVERLNLKRRTAMARHSERDKVCGNILRESKNETIAESPISVSIKRWTNASCCANVVTNKCSLCKQNAFNYAEGKMSLCKLTSSKLDQVCKGEDIFKITNLEDQGESYEVCCNQEGLKSKRKKYKTPPVTANEKDSRSADAIKRARLRLECKRWITGNEYHPPVFPRDDPAHESINLTESICKINKTLSLIAIDSLHYFYFAEGLGIDLSKKEDKTAVVILDVTHESQYIMQENFNRYTLVQFINNYTQGFLQRSLRSNNSRRFVQKFKSKVLCETKEARSVCVPELTTETFLDTILDATKDVVVMYHSPYCAFCGAIFYVYLTVAHYLREMDHLLFVRIDGDNNDLPWEYNMNRFPSILFFPAKRKEDSTVYPFSLPVTIPNLVNFILANLDGASHVEALINICESGAGEVPDLCIARTRWLCLDIIQQLLRDYRKLIRHISLLGGIRAKNKRRMTLLKLAHIKDIHLILGSTMDLRVDRRQVKLIRKKYKQFYRSVRLLELDSKMNNTKRVTKKQKNVSESNLIKTEL